MFPRVLTEHPDLENFQTPYPETMSPNDLVSHERLRRDGCDSLNRLFVFTSLSALSLLLLNFIRLEDIVSSFKVSSRSSSGSRNS